MYLSKKHVIYHEVRRPHDHIPPQGMVFGKMVIDLTFSISKMLWLNFVAQFPTALDFNLCTKKNFNSVLASSFRQNLAKFWSYKHNCPGNFERSSMNFPFSYWRRSYAPQRQGAHGPHCSSYHEMQFQTRNMLIWGK